MIKRRCFQVALVAAFSLLATDGFVSYSTKAQAETRATERDMENTLYIDLESGRVTIEMRPDLAPNHVARIKELARDGFYDGVVFHRVIDGFMAQTGDPTGTGTGGSDKPDLDAEFSDANHGRGAVSMARAQSPNSANSQFFIVFDDASFLDGQYTVWGQVTEGMELVDGIKRGEGSSGTVQNPDRMIKVQVATDAQ
ncbi:MAG: peptidylprolyl isomerase [Alphaproteobacteria bacterium]|nr:peptidylprolyl isomerase [Alphaproteobacteria bacterium]